MRKLFLTSLFLLMPAAATLAQFLGQQSLSQSSYVIDQSGNLWAWGDNFYAQLGVGDRVNRHTPVQVPVPAGAGKWVLVAGGQNFAVAVADSDKLYAWGLNDKGQIGNGAEDGIYGVPTRIQNPAGVTTWKWVSAGADHCEALTTDGRLFAWGNNDQGQLGVGTTQYIITPQPVQFPDGVTSWADVAAGPGYTMMIAQNGLLYGCGKDSSGDFEPLEGPMQVRLDTFRAYSPLPCLAASYRSESRIDQNNDVQGVLNSQDPLFYISPAGGTIQQVAAVADGGWHVLVLSDDGKIAAYGDNSYGQLTDSFSSVLVPMPAGVSQFVAIAAGLRHSLAIGNDGWLYAWGDDSVGELGIGSTINQDEPVKVLQVCPPLSMSGSLSVPSDFYKPYSITLTVKNTNASVPLTNAGAFLVIGSPLGYGDSTPGRIVPSPIALNGASSATWDGTLRQQVFDSLYPTYFAYVRATGSAPMLVPTEIVPIVAGPWQVCDPAIVEDSITGAPLAGADLIYLGPPGGIVSSAKGSDADKMVSDKNGLFTLCLKGPVFGAEGVVTEYSMSLRKENYRTIGITLSEPIPENLTFYLGPSEIQGTFTLPAPVFDADSIQKVYYPDSLVGFALSRNVIFRTLDSGISWSAMYVSDADLHDVKFLDLAHGCAVGDAGLILSTTDTGETWQSTHAGTRNLRALALIGSDTAWAVGDSGTFAEKTVNGWTVQSTFLKDDLTCIHFLDPDDGVCAGNGVYYLYNDGTWTRNSINANVRAVYYTEPGQICFAGTNGSIISYENTGIFGISLTADSTYTTNTINSLYFLNASTGYAVGDSGASFVTYDTGASWATMTEFPNTATSVNFFSLAGHGASDNGVLNYDGEPNVFHAIVRGRVTYGNSKIPIMGAEVDRIYVAVVDDTDTVSGFMDNAYTNDQGNFVFTGIDTFFHYEYHIHFRDSGISKTKHFTPCRGIPILLLRWITMTTRPPRRTPCLQ